MIPVESTIKFVPIKALPTTVSCAEGLVVPIPTLPVLDIYKACKAGEDPVSKSPNEVPETRVVSLSSVPPRITVLEEFVSPLEKASTGEKEEVSVTTPDELILISPVTVCQVGEEVAFPISICPEMGFMTETVEVP